MSWDGVKYYYHFRKDFLPPYGIGHNQTSFSDEQMQAHLSQINCEFLTRPWIAVSEFSDTVLSNMVYLEESSGILDEANMNRFFQKLKIYEQSMRALNTKAESGNGNNIIIIS